MRCLYDAVQEHTTSHEKGLQKQALSNSKETDEIHSLVPSTKNFGAIVGKIML